MEKVGRICHNEVFFLFDFKDDVHANMYRDELISFISISVSILDYHQ